LYGRQLEKIEIIYIVSVWLAHLADMMGTIKGSMWCVTDMLTFVCEFLLPVIPLPPRLVVKLMAI
jgi:hypothetical protein